MIKLRVKHDFNGQPVSPIMTVGHMLRHLSITHNNYIESGFTGVQVLSGVCWYVEEEDWLILKIKEPKLCQVLDARNSTYKPIAVPGMFNK